MSDVWTLLLAVLVGICCSVELLSHREWLVVGMPRGRSYVKALQNRQPLTQAQQARLARDEHYRSIGSGALVVHGVAKHMHAPLRAMVDGRLLHQELVDSAGGSGLSHPSGKVEAYRAWKDGRLDWSKYQAARARLETADTGKHDVSPAASSKAGGWSLNDLKELHASEVAARNGSALEPTMSGCVAGVVSAAVHRDRELVDS